ncbi:hypothetical protein Aca07nite_39340 [Actinoplanes capillaceus]|uniref:Uncharacterized protein n=1 Tax=Actinoplanes campanulatus TaxID=113559 RepID=A0ABQ3WK85_9ACTN|nr:hypothetical protein Aca07nite_39340 [Actinoplanes capillaceus]
MVRPGRDDPGHHRPEDGFWRRTFHGYVTDDGHFYHVGAPIPREGREQPRRPIAPTG